MRRSKRMGWLRMSMRIRARWMIVSRLAFWMSMTREGRRNLAYFVAKRPIETQRLGEMGYVGWAKMARDGGERWKRGVI